MPLCFLLQSELFRVVLLVLWGLTPAVPLLYLLLFSCLRNLTDVFLCLSVLSLCCCLGFCPVAVCGLLLLWAWALGCVDSVLAPQHVGSSWIRDRTCVSCTSRWIHYHWATREALEIFSCKINTPFITCCFYLCKNWILMNGFGFILFCNLKVIDNYNIKERHWKKGNLCKT